MPTTVNADEEQLAESRGAPAHDTRDLGRDIGKVMFVGFWLLMLGLVYLWASKHLLGMNNPNSDPITHKTENSHKVVLDINRYGHYVASGEINGESVTFLLDTGATSVSLSSALADKLMLEPGRPVRLSTANGEVTGYAVTLDAVSLGGLVRNDVRAHINPGLGGDEVLLGMSYLRHFQLKQHRDTLTIESYPY